MLLVVRLLGVCRGEMLDIELLFVLFGVGCYEWCEECV